MTLRDAASRDLETAARILHADVTKRARGATRGHQQAEVIVDRIGPFDDFADLNFIENLVLARDLKVLDANGLHAQPYSNDIGQFWGESPTFLAIHGVQRRLQIVGDAPLGRALQIFG